uniref:Transposon protein, putative, CACTA, En/Spm sub-class n=3 Tax=Oryza sativa subsp. japonica TaxID=39947 RepID=Q53N56_ORYSJ|nr:transposon protein, putative, CACTA, En/Spm sub-class [Oryza sativa Japonica Group]ABA92676.1 transposon protein, putative, CACTA, En/Spm sub-class [Oryza sativa Japonica Group]
MDAKNGVSDKPFGDLLKLVKNILPEGNKLPETTYEAKKIVCPLGLEVQKIHACPNDCILYRGEEYENLEACPVCKALLYKIRRDDPGEVDGQLTKKRIPTKVMWYFPIIPWLRRLFRNKGNARTMRWHAEERQQDGMLRHPADGSQWRNIDRKFKDFGKDARNIRFGLSTDGMNPFGEMSSGHSTWPVTMCIYNLPPWLCMKRKYIMMPIIIQGPKQPGNDIDVYLRPLVKDLKLLWKKEGIPVWDEDKQEEFNLRVLLFVTINDWPALSNLSGQSNKAYKACTHCMDETESMYLKHCRKVVYMGHNRFLAANHPVRKKGKHFEHKVDHRMKPKHRSGKTMFAMVKDLKVVFGKGSGSQPIESEDGHAAMWKKNSIFWELPYWEFLDVRHAIDVMHLTKNLCVNLLGFLGVYGKSKDTLEARNDLKHMEQRGDLHPEPKEKGSHYLSPASYTLSKAKKKSMFECLESIKKVIDPDRLEALQNDVVQCLVSFELIFPPSFFNIMTHLLCHLVKEIGILGPVYLYFREVDGRSEELRQHLMGNETINQQLAFLARGQSGSIATLQGYEINGYTFYTRAQDMKSTNQNSAVRIDAMGHDGTTGTYYGAIEDIWELDYGPLKVPLFRCQWVRLTGGGVTIDDSGMTTVDLNKVGYSDEPFVLANDVTQVFYVKDMSSKGKKGKGPDEPKRHVVLPGKRKIVGVEDKTNEDYDQLDGQPPFTVTIDPSILLLNEDTPYSRSDHKEGTIVRRKKDVVVVVPQAGVMVDRDEEQILYDSIAEGSSQYWNEEEGNEDPNQYLNEEGNVERDAEGNQEGNVEKDAEWNEEKEASGSQPSGGQKRARGQRGAAKKLDDHESFVLDSEKEMLWTTMLETFTLPAGTENIVKRWTLKKMVEQFQSFKGDLYQKFILKGQTPNFDTFPKLRDHWDEFVAYKTGQQGQAMMERNKENAAMKKYHHHLGSGSYSVAMPKWEEMDASLLERGIEPATAKWLDRSKFWYYAHGRTLNPVDGSLVFSDQIREAASRLTDAVEASSQGTFRPDREKDELSLALQTPEHPGRTRGKWVIPWKIGFKEDIHTYRSRMRSTRDTEAKIADLEYRVSSYELSMQEEVARKVDERMAAHRSHDPQPYIPPAMVSPSGNRSSCASTGQVASGMAIPTDPLGTYHCRPIPPGYSKVEVELVKGAYEDLELNYLGRHAPSPPQALAPTPPQAPAPTPPQAPRPAPSKSRASQAPPLAPTRATKKAKVDATKNKQPGYDCMQEELDVYVASEVRRQLKPRSPEKKIPIDPSVRNFFSGMSAPAKEAIKLSDYERTLKKAFSGKSKPVPQLGEQPNQ